MSDEVEDLMGGPSLKGGSNSSSVAAGQLRSLVDRIERLEDDKKAITDDLKEVYAEAKAGGFDTKTIRRVLAWKKQNREEIAEEESLLELYLSALGLI